MLKRKIYDDLIEWKNIRRNEQIRKCLLIKGARQVGKSFIVKEFGKREYSSFLCIDFFRNPELKYVFEGNLTSEEILKRMNAEEMNQFIGTEEETSEEETSEEE